MQATVENAIQSIKSVLSGETTSTWYSEYTNSVFSTRTDLYLDSALFLRWSGDYSFVTLAETWSYIVDELNPTNRLLTAPPTTEAIHLNFDPVAAAFCKAKGLDATEKIVETLLRVCFKGISEIEVEFALDPEITGFYKVNFRVTLADDVDSVLKCERDYYKQIGKFLSVQERQFIALTYHLLPRDN